MTVAAREKAIADFQELPEVTVLVVSLKAAALGLNLVAANHVVLLDLWWNPTTEEQAIDRAHRIGQTRPVHVTRITIKGAASDSCSVLQGGFCIHGRLTRAGVHAATSSHCSVRQCLPALWRFATLILSTPTRVANLEYKRAQGGLRHWPTLARIHFDSCDGGQCWCVCRSLVHHSVSRCLAASVFSSAGICEGCCVLHTYKPVEWGWAGCRHC